MKAIAKISQNIEYSEGSRGKVWLSQRPLEYETALEREVDICP